MNSVDIDLHTVARQMLQYGGRASIVQAETGLSASRINALYDEVCGGKPKPRGSFIYSAKRFFRDRDKLRDALLFALFYRIALKEDHSGFPTLSAYGMYRIFRPWGGFDYTDAFAVARFLMNGQMFIQYCGGCGAATLRLPNNDAARCLVCGSCIPGNA